MDPWDKLDEMMDITVPEQIAQAVAAERERCASKLVAYIAEHGGTIELCALVDAIREGE